MPQPRQTRYEQPCTVTGQLILRCQHPRVTRTANPASPVAATLTGKSQRALGFFPEIGFSEISFSEIGFSKIRFFEIFSGAMPSEFRGTSIKSAYGA